MTTSNRVLDNLDYLYEGRVQPALDIHAAYPATPDDCAKDFDGLTSGIQALSKRYLEEAIRIVREIEKTRGLISDMKQAQKDNLVLENDHEAMLDDLYDYSKAVFRLRRELERAMRGVADCDDALNKFGNLVAEGENKDGDEEEELDPEEGDLEEA